MTLKQKLVTGIALAGVTLAGLLSLGCTSTPVHLNPNINKENARVICNENYCYESDTKKVVGTRKEYMNYLIKLCENSFEKNPDLIMEWDSPFPEVQEYINKRRQGQVLINNVVNNIKEESRIQAEKESKEFWNDVGKRAIGGFLENAATIEYLNNRSK